LTIVNLTTEVMRVNRSTGTAVLRTNRLEIDTGRHYSTSEYILLLVGSLVDQVYSNLPGPWNVLGEPDAWIEIRQAGNTYSVPGYIF
jgi:hypothetical protein